jgi:hypothetical protein
LLPRSYEKDVHEGQTKAFVLTANPGKEFETNYDNLLSKKGKEIVESNTLKFNVST